MPTITVNGRAVAYAETGEGPTVLLLHSSASSGRQWRALTEKLAQDFRLVAPDLMGYGESDPWEGEGAQTLADEAAAVLPFIEGADGPVHVIGHSYGGAVALVLALDNPDAVLSLTLYEPVAFWLLDHGGADDAALLSGVREFADAMAARVDAGDDAGAMAAFVDLWNQEGAFAALAPERRDDLAARAGKVVGDFAALTAEPTPLSALSALTMPALVLRGGRSPAASRRIAEILAETLPAARLGEIADAGHMGPVTHPDAVNPLLAEHLGRALGIS